MYFFYMALGRGDFDGSKSQFFWAQMALAVPFQGPKSLDFQGPFLTVALEMDFARIKII
jgi:hypothetical protein